MPKRKEWRGGNNGVAANPKLTPAKVRWIKRILMTERLMRAEEGRKTMRKGMRIRLAKAAGVSVSTIKQIDRGKRWRKVSVRFTFRGRLIDRSSTAGL